MLWCNKSSEPKVCVRACVRARARFVPRSSVTDWMDNITSADTKLLGAFTKLRKPTTSFMKKPTNSLVITYVVY
jgi:hypothetical protein